jgi:hypothetical protein
LADPWIIGLTIKLIYVRRPPMIKDPLFLFKGPLRLIFEKINPTLQLVTIESFSPLKVEKLNTDESLTP